MAVETHLRKEQTAEEAKKHKANYDSTVSFARESTESETGSYGGAWVAAMKHLNTSHINGTTQVGCSARVQKLTFVEETCISLTAT